MENKKTEHVLFGTLFVVEMYRWGDLEEHHYTAGIFDNEKEAKICGLAEHYWRGTKYEPVIYKHNINKWRNAAKKSMHKELEENNSGNLSLEELWDKKEAYGVKELRKFKENHKK